MLFNSELDHLSNPRPVTSYLVSPNSSQIIQDSDTNINQTYSTKATVNRRIKLDIKYQELLSDMKKIRTKSASLVKRNLEKVNPVDKESNKKIVSSKQIDTYFYRNR
jgi:hypothetical protein